MYVFPCVLSSIGQIIKLWTNLDKIFWGVGCVISNSWLDLGGAQKFVPYPTPTGYSIHMRHATASTAWYATASTALSTIMGLASHSTTNANGPQDIWYYVGYWTSNLNRLKDSWQRSVVSTWHVLLFWLVYFCSIIQKRPITILSVFIRLAIFWSPEDWPQSWLKLKVCEKTFIRYSSAMGYWHQRADERNRNPPPRQPGAICGQRQRWKTPGEQVRGMWYFYLQCFDTVGWVTGRASGL